MENTPLAHEGSAGVERVAERIDAILDREAATRSATEVKRRRRRTASAPVVAKAGSQEIRTSDLRPSELDAVRDLLTEEDIAAFETEEEYAGPGEPVPEGSLEAESETAEETEEETEGEEAFAEEGQEGAVTLEVTLDGKPEEVTLTVSTPEEKRVLEELKRGYLRESDYTRKTTALAQTRKTMEGLVAELSQKREAYVQSLSQVEAWLRGMEEQARIESERLLEEGDVAGYLAHKKRMEEAAEARKQTEAQIRAQIAAEEADREKQFRAWLQEQERKVVELLPHWRDPAVRQKEGLGIVRYLQRLGFTDEEIGAVYDARLNRVVYDAWRFHELQRKVKESREKRTPEEGRILPTASKGPLARQRRAFGSKINRFKSTGSPQDAAELIEGMI